jgi:hypothetical protein
LDRGEEVDPAVRVEWAFNPIKLHVVRRNRQVKGFHGTRIAWRVLCPGPRPGDDALCCAAPQSALFGI